MSKEKNLLLLITGVFLLGLFLRFYLLSDGLIFGYDQARDAYRATEIISKGKLKLLGPETDIPGVHHGVGYYYLLSIPYAISHDPALAAYFMAFLSALGIFISYLAAWEFFRSKKLAFIVSILFAVSFEMVQYARWLSNPSLGVLSVMLAFLGLHKWIKGDQRGFLLAVFTFAISLHFQFFLAYLFLMPLVIYLLYRPKIYYHKLILAIAGALIIDSPIIISEFKFNFQTIRAFSSFFSGHAGSYTALFDFIQRYLHRLESVIFHTVFPLDQRIIFILMFLGTIVLYKFRRHINRKSPVSLLLLWLFSSFPIFFFSSGAINSEFSFVGTAVSLLFLTAFLIDKFWSKNPLQAKTLLLIIVVINIRFNLMHARDGAYIFSDQSVMTYGLEKQLIDYTYLEADGRPFSICTLTNPLFVNTTWAYLYENYGRRKYSYLPFFAGSDQSSYLGYLPKDTTKPKLRYIIYEPLIGIPQPAQEIFEDMEELVSDKIEERNFGTFKVIKRYLLTDKEMRIKKAGFDPGLTKQLENDSYLPYRCFH